MKETCLPHIILASRSPRRRRVLEELGVSFEARASAYDETHDPTDCPRCVVETHARAKAEDVRRDAEDDCLVIGADTVVWRDGTIYGKPRDRADARQMLSSLQGTWHEVFTGLAVYHGAADAWHVCHVRTSVKMRELDAAAITAYCSRIDPCDKAGAYGIQELGGIIIERIDGCYYNVMGFPIAQLDEVNGACGYSLLTGCR